MINFYSYFESALFVSAVSWPVLATLVITERLAISIKAQEKYPILLLAWSICGAIGYFVTNSTGSLIVSAFGYICSKATRKWLVAFYESGSFFIVTVVLTIVLGVGWGTVFVFRLEISLFSRVLMLLGMVLASAFIPLTIFTALPLNSYLYRKTWKRPRSVHPASELEIYPMVSIHVPCYSEPPEVVLQTLKSINEINYPNFEVIVIDNNTEDPALWTPIKKYCDTIGTRFRFFHVDSLRGAKAGALNYSLRETAAEATIISVIDSDYIVESNFIIQLIGYFDDPTIGFVQTPHDYQVNGSNIFQTACYWEYMPAYRLQIASLNEWSASYIIGTMCLIRKEALINVGGWAEWCLTEDSECALRIHACSYKSVYVPITMGRGLIPESHYEYKKQRLRWTIGPIQQLRKHWKILLISSKQNPMTLDKTQRLLEIVHSLREANAILSIPMLALILLLAISLVYNNDFVVVPTVIWAAIILIFAARISIRWLTYRLAGCDSLVKMIWASMAAFSLSHTKLVGAIQGLFRSEELFWHRTNKFPQTANISRALESTAAEIAIGFLLLLMAFIAWYFSNVSEPDILLVISLYFSSNGLIYLTSPFMALVAELNLSSDRNSSGSESRSTSTSCRSG